MSFENNIPETISVTQSTAEEALQIRTILNQEHSNEDDVISMPTYIPEYSAEYISPVCNWG